MGFAPTWLRQVSPPPLHVTTLTTGHNVGRRMVESLSNRSCNSRLSVGVVRRVVRPLVVMFCSRHLCTASPETSESVICLHFPRLAKPASTASQQRCTFQTQCEEEILLLTGSKITDTI